MLGRVSWSDFRQRLSSPPADWTEAHNRVNEPCEEKKKKTTFEIGKVIVPFSGMQDIVWRTLPGLLDSLDSLESVPFLAFNCFATLGFDLWRPESHANDACPLKANEFGPVKSQLISTPVVQAVFASTSKLKSAFLVAHVSDHLWLFL